MLVNAVWVNTTWVNCDFNIVWRDIFTELCVNGKRPKSDPEYQPSDESFNDNGKLNWAI